MKSRQRKINKSNKDYPDARLLKCLKCKFFDGGIKGRKKSKHSREKIYKYYVDCLNENGKPFDDYCNAQIRCDERTFDMRMREWFNWFKPKTKNHHLNSDELKKEGDKKMPIDVTKAELIEEFEGKLVSFDKEPNQKRDGEYQYHLQISPNDEELLKGTETGRFHEWLNITSTTTDKSVADGSKLHRYLQEIEACFGKSAVKDINTVEGYFGLLKDKSVKYVRKVLGKSYGGYESKPVFIPQSVIEGD